MKSIFSVVSILALFFYTQARGQTFSLRDITSYPFSSGLTTSATGSRIALAVNEQGKRNIYVGEGPDFKLRKLTNRDQDEGVELSSVSLSPDGKWVVYVTGGDHGAFDESTPRNPSSAPAAPAVQIWSVPFDGGEAVCISEGDFPVISPGSDHIAFVRNSQVWEASLDGEVLAKQMFYARGNVHSLQWSPTGEELAFVASRKDHAFIGVFRGPKQPIQWLSPDFASDHSPRWSADGKSVAFIRTTGGGGAPDSLLALRHNGWSIWRADIANGKGSLVWRAPKTLRGSEPRNAYLQWAGKDRLTFVSAHDGWHHLYSVGADGGKELLLTPGNYMVEQVRLSWDKNWLVFSTNAGPDKEDIDRRHVARVRVDVAGLEILTPGQGIEEHPIMTGDGKSVVMITSTTNRPPLPGVLSLVGRQKGYRLLGDELLPASFPGSKLLVPRQVVFKSPDNLNIHGQLFMPAKEKGKRPAVVFVHGGPRRQILLGWNQSDYYANTYAINQYLANQGFIVLTVNYRLGIGYGYDFYNPANGGRGGASEYQDVKAAGEYLASLADVDASRIGIYGGSYGGFLTALALGRDSKLFAAGVDIHGVHNFSEGVAVEWGEQAPDLEKAKDVFWQSSPVSWVDKWTSPVLIIHGDDDGNVGFHESVDLVRRLEKKEVEFETLVIPDETHHWMKYSNTLKVNSAIAEFLIRKLKP